MWFIATPFEPRSIATVLHRRRCRHIAQRLLSAVPHKVFRSQPSAVVGVSARSPQLSLAGPLSTGQNLALLAKLGELGGSLAAPGNAAADAVFASAAGQIDMGRANGHAEASPDGFCRWGNP